MVIDLCGCPCKDDSVFLLGSVGVCWVFFCVFFFFQAEDGIRDRNVTGVSDVCSSDLSDRGTQYAHVIEMDASEIYPMVATPGDPGNGKYVRDLNTPVPVEIAYGGTCTAGKNEDMEDRKSVV